MPKDQRRYDREEVHLTTRALPQDDLWPVWVKGRQSVTLRQMAGNACTAQLNPGFEAYIRKYGKFPDHKKHQMTLSRAYAAAHTPVCRQVKAGQMVAQLPAGENEEERQALEDIMWVELETTVTEEWVQEVFGTEGYPSRDNTKNRTREWTVRWICQGNLLDDKPSEAGEKLTSQRNTLQALRDMMVAGWQTPKGKQHIFFNIDDMAARDATRRTPEGRRDGE